MRQPFFLVGLLMALAASSVSRAAESPRRAARWAVLVGVDQYKYIAPNLKCCGADVRALGDRLVQSGFGKDRVAVLHDRADPSLYPTKSNIEKQLRLTLETLGPEDFVFVGFSGHGVRLAGRSYLCPYDAKMDPADLLPVNAIYKQLQDCPAKFKLFLVDACQDEKSQPKELVATRTADEVKAFGLTADEKLPEGILQVTSCSAGQKAVEEPKFGHGVFTYYLLEGLDGKADADQSGSVSLLEWTGYASSRTRAYVRSLDRAQSPSMKGEFPDFDLAPVPRSRSLPQEITNSIGMKLRLISAGEFLMGSPESEKDRTSDEDPQHRVRITKPFYMGVYEVTQAEYEKVMGDNPSKFKGATLPVESVTWNNAVEFCRRLSEKEGKTYRLPTEAEWEYACRAGTTTPFNFGSVLNGDQANCGDGNYPYGTETKGPYKERTAPVGSYRANAFGLYDMHGNVYEWCADWYDKEYYANSPTDDPPGPTSPTSGSSRVGRGGGWLSYAEFCRSAHRFSCVPGYRYGDLGFRVSQVAE